MAIFAVPLETQVRKPSDATLRAKDSAAFIHEAEDLVVFSPYPYKDIGERRPALTDVFIACATFPVTLTHA